MLPIEMVFKYLDSGPCLKFATARHIVEYSTRFGGMAHPVAVHAPPSLRERVLFEFRSPRNRAYLANAFQRELPHGDRRLEFILSTLDVAILEYSGTSGAGGALLDADPLAIRGSGSRSGNVLEELKHLNQTFFQQRIAESNYNFVPRERITKDLDAVTGADAPWGDNEELYYKLFVRDSLRPKGLEYLNDRGPLWALHEDQRPFAPKEVAQAPQNFAETFNPSIAIEDQAWSAGDATRSASSLCEQYYGGEEIFDRLDLAEDYHASGRDSTAAIAGSVAVREGGSVVQEWFDPIACSWQVPNSAVPPTHLQAAAMRAQSSCRDVSPTIAELSGSQAPSSGGRAERRGIPLYQRAAPRYNVIHARAEVDETLGSGSHEFGGELMSPVRRWDMTPARTPFEPAGVKRPEHRPLRSSHFGARH